LIVGGVGMPRKGSDDCVRGVEQHRSAARTGVAAARSVGVESDFRFVSQWGRLHQSSVSIAGSVRLTTARITGTPWTTFTTKTAYFTVS
jgi:hypothetical protein